MPLVLVCFSVHFHIECTVKKSVLSMFMLKLRNQYTYFVGILSRYICIELVLWKSIPYRDIRVSAKPGYALITSPNLLGIVLLSLGWLNFGVVVTLSEFKYLMSVNEVLQSIKCPINNIQSQFLTLLHFIQTQFNVR